MSLARLARSTPWIQGPQVHLTHQALDPLAVDRVPALLQLVTHPPAAVERQLEMDLVDEPHHSKVRLADRLATVVRARAWHIEQLAAPRLGQVVLLVNPASALAHRSRPSTLDKKSFSIASRPILAWSFSTSFSLC